MLVITIIIFIFLFKTTTSRTYHGDYDTVDDHLRKNKVRGESEECEEEGDDICSGSFDTIAHIRNELFVFVKTKLWRFSDRGLLRWVKTPVGRLETETGYRRGYPAPGRQMFGFTRDIERSGESREESLKMFVCRIDAVYERLTDGAILFFSGRKYWRSDGNHITGNSHLPHNYQPTPGIDPRPRDLSDFGIVSNVTKIDAVFVWGKNQKTYFFAGDQYWR